MCLNHLPAEFEFANLLVKWKIVDVNAARAAKYSRWYVFYGAIKIDHNVHLRADSERIVSRIVKQKIYAL